MSAILETLLATGDEGIDLDLAALDIARFENPHVDTRACIAALDGWAAELESRLSPSAGGSEFVTKANQLLFSDLKFRGDQDSYFHPSNSCLDKVIANRKGLPITLSVVYLELSRRLLRPAFGVALPAHFVVRYNDGLFTVYVDVFNNGAFLSEAQCRELVCQMTGSRAPVSPMAFAAATKRQIVVRMMRNLQNAYLRTGDTPKAAVIQTFLERHLPAQIPFNSL